MRKLVLALPFAVALIAATVSASPAAVNCAAVNRDLKLGRWPEDIAESMGITLSDVKNCRDKGAAAGNAAPAKPGATPASATSSAARKQPK